MNWPYRLTNWTISGHRLFKSQGVGNCLEVKIKFIWPYRLTVRTSAFQAGNPGSIPGKVTK